ncbi:nucleotide-binding domain-containing protein [Tilletiaria anomala UBC 951]|uniref:Nucleotide-binding domain-containing protein n=1 Tax=Tilletiaria anomala (strain ATCC 24038 / CBS 436.72 / UBC 951) TaxID=1037660 RepID=A0A066WHP1_TILAU|nr:nucleotide-binding domain-containing protein [Tilletiaria anomala UBC 951]KDN52038.1 nucleotide-binding domain-containing protein [Tilletiaria anomala UBC 951]
MATASIPTANTHAQAQHIVVLGAGVIGLTSAHVLQRRGYQVTIAARDLPEDADSPAFASPWAGANWCSFASHSNFEQQRYDQITFETWTELEKHLPTDTIALLPFEQNRVQDPAWFKHVTPHFRLEPLQEKGFLRATFKSHCINVPSYTKWLVSELLDPASSIVPTSPFLDDLESQVPSISCNGSPQLVPVSFQRVPELSSLAELSRRFPEASVIVNASGLGAAKLADVRDLAMYPIAGQVVVVHAPRFRTLPQCKMGALTNTPSASESVPFFSHTVNGNKREAGPKSDIEPTAEEKAFPEVPVSYVIPRAQSGFVILGGSYEEGSYDTQVNEQLSQTILQNAIQLCPDLLLRPPEEYRHSDGQPMMEDERREVEMQEIRAICADPSAWKRLEVVSSHVGLRPARKAGVRVEMDEVPIKSERSAPSSSNVKVVHAYGIGPAGYQASWGVAHQVAMLVKKSLAKSSLADSIAILSTIAST